MAAAVGRLFRARERNESLVVFGDYDVDGVTSTALLVEVLRPSAGRWIFICRTAWTKATDSALMVLKIA